MYRGFNPEKEETMEKERIAEIAEMVLKAAFSPETGDPVLGDCIGAPEAGLDWDEFGEAENAVAALISEGHPDLDVEVTGDGIEVSPKYLFFDLESETYVRRRGPGCVPVPPADFRCPRCGGPMRVSLSQLIPGARGGYHYQCFRCDEDFYRCECRKGAEPPVTKGA